MNYGHETEYGQRLDKGNGNNNNTDTRNTWEHMGKGNQQFKGVQVSSMKHCCV
jgi:hypothetical protein